MNTSEKTDMISASLFAVHRDLSNPTKDAKGQVRGNANYRYLSLPALIDHAKAALKNAQVSVIQDVRGGAGFVEVSTIFLHFSGQYIEVGPLFMPAAGDAQAVGSAVSYARRYALAAALNLAPDEDDDGRKASKWQTSPPAPVRTVEPTPDSKQARGDGPDELSPLPVGVAVSSVGVSDNGGGEASESDTPATLEGTDEPASPEQWHRLLQVVGGSKAKAVNRLNKANKTSFTAATSIGATATEVANAISGGES